MADWPYNTARWQRLRRLKLSSAGLCEDCRRIGLVRPAQAVDHRVPISAGGEAFPDLDGLASLCYSCHSKKTARGVEAGAARTSKPRSGCDAQGNPLDPRHPWNDTGPLAGTHLLARPFDLRPSVSSLVIVFGPSGAGKSTWVQAHVADDDQVLDLDVIVSDLSGLPIYTASDEWVADALRWRNRRLRELANIRQERTTWLIVSGATADERAWWKAALRPQRCILIMSDLKTCISRIRADTRRGNRKAEHIRACYRWFARYTPCVICEHTTTKNLSGLTGEDRVVPILLSYPEVSDGR